METEPLYVIRGTLAILAPNAPLYPNPNIGSKKEYSIENLSEIFGKKIQPNDLLINLHCNVLLVESNYFKITAETLFSYEQHFSMIPSSIPLHMLLKKDKTLPKGDDKVLIPMPGLGFLVVFTCNDGMRPFDENLYS